MHDGAVGAGAGNGVEADVVQLAGLLAQRLQPVGSLDLAQFAAVDPPAEPAQEAADRGAVTAVGLADALELDRVLAGLGQSHRIWR